MRSRTLFFIIILLITIVVIWKCYWRIQIMYNSSILSLYTPDSFNLPLQYTETHNTVTKSGFKVMKEKTIVICSLLRDVEVKLPEIEKRAENLGRMFRDYRILIVENDSVDDTRKYLLNWTKRNARVTILGCGENAKSCSLSNAAKKTYGHSVDRQRIEKMTRLRNIYLEYVKRNFSQFDYLAVWDLDIVGTVYLDGVANTIGHFEKMPDTDAICAYGIYRWGLFTLYYDTYAHIDKNDKFHIDMKFIHDLKKGFGVKYKRGTPPIEVTSCFSGFTIYRIRSLRQKDIIYDMTPKDEGNLECEHVRLHTKLNKIYMNPSMIHFVLLND